MPLSQIVKYPDSTELKKRFIFTKILFLSQAYYIIQNTNSSMKVQTIKCPGN